MSDDERDARLAARLRTTDPAAGLTPLDPAALAALVETATSPATTTPLSDPAARPRRWVGAAVLGVAAAAAVVVGGVVVAGQGGPDPRVVALTAPAGGGVGAMCAELTPDGLAGNDLAVAGEVTAIDSGTVTLTVTDAFSGDVAVDDRLTLPQGDPAAVLDGGSPPFELAGSYLVAARDGLLAGCGATGTDSPELRALYEAAFPG